MFPHQKISIMNHCQFDNKDFGIVVWINKLKFSFNAFWLLDDSSLQSCQRAILSSVLNTISALWCPEIFFVTLEKLHVMFVRNQSSQLNSTYLSPPRVQMSTQVPPTQAVEKTTKIYALILAHPPGWPILAQFFVFERMFCTSF